MAYAFEQDDLKQELTISVAGTISLWPKLSGTGNLDITSATYTVYDPDGTVVEASQSATLTTVGSVERIDCTVAAIATLDEDYYLDIAWVYSGNTETDRVFFDVVRFPWATNAVGSISLNDLQEERPDIDDILTRLGGPLGSKTAEEMASIMGYRARVEIDAMIRNRIQMDRSATLKDYESAGIRRDFSRPSLVMNRHHFNRLERSLALMLIFRGDCSQPEEGDDESSSLYRMYRMLSGEHFESLVIEYDNDEDGIADETIVDPGGYVITQRVQG